MMDIQVHVDTSTFHRQMENFADQLPYSIARAINAVAVDAQGNVRKSAQANFHIRREGYMKQTVGKIKPFAKKTDLTATISVVGPNANPDRNLFAKFEDGGTKTGITGGNIAIPMEAVRPTEDSLIAKKNRPRNLANAFKLVSKNGRQLIMQRIGHGPNDIQVAYVLKQSVPIPRKLQFEDVVLRTVNELWEHRFSQAWDYAVNTAFEKDMSSVVEKLLG